MEIFLMQISNNFSSPNFAKLYAGNSTLEKMGYLAQNQYTAKEFKKAYDELQQAAEGRDILIQADGDGISIHEADPKTEKTKFIYKNDDFIKGMQRAADKIKEFYKKPEAKTPRVRFPGRNTGVTSTELNITG